MRLRAWFLIAVRLLADKLSWITYGRHLTTDPACHEYRAPRSGSRLDRASRGQSCMPCMADRRWTAWARRYAEQVSHG